MRVWGGGGGVSVGGGTRQRQARRATTTTTIPPTLSPPRPPLHSSINHIKMSSLYTTDALAHPYSSDSENDGTYTLNTPRGKGYTKHKGLEAPAQVSRIRTSVHPIRQPLSSTMSGNTDPVPAVSTSSRLKRLSLIGGPSSYTPRDDVSPGSPVAGPSTPRRSVGMRSSISYSPALSGTGTGHAQAGHVRAEQNRGSIELATPRSSLRTSFEAQQGLGSRTDSARSGEGVVKEERGTRKKGETLLEQWVLPFKNVEADV